MLNNNGTIVPNKIQITERSFHIKVHASIELLKNDTTEHPLLILKCHSLSK